MKKRILWHYLKRPKIFSLNSWEKRNWGDDEGDKTTQETQSTQTMAPQDYAESTAARGNWWQTLQDWQKQGNYGAIEPNYDEIYNQASKKINQYYWGSPTGPGAIDKIKSNVAQRGVQDSPTTGVLSSRLAAEEANQLGGTAERVYTQKAAAGEQARTNWLNSLMGLSNLKSGAYTSTGNSTTTTTQPATNFMDFLGTMGGALATGAGYAFGGPVGGGLVSTLTSMMSPQKTQSSLTDRGVSSAFTNFGSDWMGG